MKKLIVLLLAIASYATSAQVIITSTTASTTKERKFVRIKSDKISYRGYVEGAGIVCFKGAAGISGSFAQGIQFNPRWWVGIGVNVSRSWAYKEGLSEFPQERFPTHLFYYEGGVWHYPYTGHTTSTKDAIHWNESHTPLSLGWWPFHLYVETKINLFNFNRSHIPHIKLAIGTDFWDLYSHLKFGGSVYNQNKTLAFNYHVGAMYLNHGHETRYDFNYRLKVDRDAFVTGTAQWIEEEGRGSLFAHVHFPLFFTAGVGFEFGGGAGLKRTIN